MNCTSDLGCAGKLVCGGRRTAPACQCPARGFVGEPGCDTPHPSLYVDAVVLMAIELAWVFVATVAVKDLVNFAKLRSLALKTSAKSSLLTTALLALGALAAVVRTAMDMACNLSTETNASSVVYGEYKACGLYVVGSVFQYLSLLWGFLAALNVSIDWINLIQSTGARPKWASTFVWLHRIVRTVQLAYALALLAGVVSLRFDLVLILQVPFFVGLSVVYAVCGKILVDMLLVAESTALATGRSPRLGVTAVAGSAGEVPDRGQMARQLTFEPPTQQLRGGMTRQQTSGIDFGGEHVEDPSSSSNGSSSRAQMNATAAAIRRMMLRIRFASYALGFTMSVTFVFSAASFLLLVPLRTVSFGNEPGGWARPAHWLFLCAMVALPSVALVLLMYVHPTNVAHYAKLEVMRHFETARAGQGERTGPHHDSFQPSSDPGTTLGRDAGSTVVVVAVSEMGLVRDGDLGGGGANIRGPAGLLERGASFEAVLIGTRGSA